MLQSDGFRGSDYLEEGGFYAGGDDLENLSIDVDRFFQILNGNSDPTTRRSPRQLNEGLSQQPESSQNSTTGDAIFTQVMGEDRRGQVRTFGLGVTPSDIYGPRASIAEARAAAAEARAAAAEARAAAAEAQTAAVVARAAAVESARIAEMERAQRIALQAEAVQMRIQLNQLMTWMQSFTGSGPSLSSSGPVFGATPNDIQRDG